MVQTTGNPDRGASDRLFTAGVVFWLLANLLVGGVWLNSGYHGLEWQREVRPRIQGRVAEAVRSDWTLPWRAFYHQGGDEVMYFEYTNRLLGQPVDEGLLQAKHGRTPGFERYFDEKSSSGRVPYRDAWTEYPPMALPFLLAPRLLANDVEGYGYWFAWEMTALLVVATALAVWMLEASVADAGGRQRTVIGALVCCVCFQLAMGTMLITRYDAAVSCLVVSALFAQRRMWVMTGGVLLAAAASAKIFPLMLIPLFYAGPLLRGERRELALGLGGVLLGCVAFNLPFAISGGDGYWDVFRYHAQRGLEANSTYAALLTGMAKLGLTTVAGEFRFGCMEVVGPGVSGMTWWATVASLVVGAVVVGRYVWALKQGYEDEVLLPTFCLAMTVGFIVSGKVFSPQYVVWCFPLVLLVPGAAGVRARRVLLVVALLVQLDHPWLRGVVGLEFPPTWFGWSLIAGRIVGMGCLFWLALTAFPARYLKRGKMDERAEQEPTWREMMASC